ncbi:MAG: RNA polymerase primary sigma factor [Candidatus Latescibacterota bacterium]|jgi:RNA polymerase primary sigma factor
MATASVWDSEVLDIYFQDISNAVPLPSEEEVRLAKLIHQGDEDARNELVAANLRFVVRVASEYQNCGLPLEDLIGAGNVGLIHAAERFDEKRGFKFITYAHWWIRQGIYNAITLESRLVRLPANRVKLLSSITKLLRQLGQANVTDPSSEFIAQELGVSVEMIDDTLLRAQDVCSLDADVDEEDHAPINVLSDDAQALPDADVIAHSDRRLIERVLNTLEDREAQVLRLHFGLEGQEPRTLARIGKGLGLTKERVRQIKEKALSKLRHPLRRGHLNEVRDAG